MAKRIIITEWEKNKIHHIKLSPNLGVDMCTKIKKM